MREWTFQLDNPESAIYQVEEDSARNIWHQQPPPFWSRRTCMHDKGTKDLQCVGLNEESRVHFHQFHAIGRIPLLEFLFLKSLARILWPFPDNVQSWKPATVNLKYFLHPSEERRCLFYPPYLLAKLIDYTGNNYQLLATCFN